MTSHKQPTAEQQAADWSYGFLAEARRHSQERRDDQRGDNDDEAYADSVGLRPELGLTEEQWDAAWDAALARHDRESRLTSNEARVSFRERLTLDPKAKARCVSALRDWQAECLSDYDKSELIGLLVDAWVGGNESTATAPGYAQQDANQLWVSCREAWMIDAESDWDDADVRVPFLAWLREHELLAEGR